MVKLRILIVSLKSRENSRMAYFRGTEGVIDIVIKISYNLKILFLNLISINQNKLLISARIGRNKNTSHLWGLMGRSQYHMTLGNHMHTPIFYRCSDRLSGGMYCCCVKTNKQTYIYIFLNFIDLKKVKNKKLKFINRWNIHERGNITYTNKMDNW